MTLANPIAAGAAATMLAASDARRTAAALAAAFTAMTILGFWPTAATMANAWLSSSSYHHGALVFPIALWLLYRLGAPDAAPLAWPPALVGVGAAVAVWLVGHAASINLLEQIAFVSLLIAGVALTHGPVYARHWAFALAFLYFMVPFGGSILPALQGMAAASVVSMLNASGLSVSLDGVVITTATGRFEIAEACAGLNFLIAAGMVAALFSHLAFASARKMMGFVVFALALAVAANILRAYLVILAATLTRGQLSIGADHLLLGWVFYGVLLFVLVQIGRRFADRVPVEPSRRAARRQALLTQRYAPVVVFVAGAAMLFGAFAYGRIVIDSAPTADTPHYLPLFNAPGWRALNPSPEWQAHLEHSDRVVRARYQSGALAVHLNVAYFTHDRAHAEIAGSQTRSFDGEDWRRIGVRKATLFAFGARRRVAIETLENRSGQRLEAITLYWLDERVFSDPRAIKARQARERLLGHQNRGGAFILAAPAPKKGEGLRAIEAFLESVEPLPAWLARIDTRFMS